MALLERTIRSLRLLLLLLLLCGSYGQRENHKWLEESPDEDRFDAEPANDRQLILRYLVKTLTAVEKAINYIGRHIEKINLDGLIGVREAESKLTFLVSSYWPHLPPEISRKMRDLVILSQKASVLGMKVVKTATPKYYSLAYPLLEAHFWDLNFPSRTINTSLIQLKGKEQSYTEEQSDYCLTELFGNAGQKRCRISYNCWKIMTGKEYSAYSLTHEVFYLINGIHASCLTELEEAAQKYEGKSVNDLLDYFCANIYQEALTIEQNGFKAESIDLFMEQIGLCGDAGYMEFAKWRWLPLILRIQRPNGCYGILKGERINPRNFDPNGYGKSKRSIQKRVEQKMSEDGCLSHRISVALSALNIFARRLVEYIARDTI